MFSQHLAGLVNLVFPLKDCYAANTVDASTVGIVSEIDYDTNLDDASFNSMSFQGQLRSYAILPNTGQLDVIVSFTILLKVRLTSK